jgi:acyl carrier protein
MQIEQIKSQLKQILVERLSIDIESVNAADDAGLFDEAGWGIDSVDVLDLVLGIEKVFGIRIGQDDDIKRHFESIQTLAAYIETQTQPQPEPLAA